ncbi:MAG: tetratricopeptide repeat protein [Neisseriaceae bacterium]|nr:MAG: tetratricopeptide repeat protein [Neisseriaceae bacterium]
MALDLQQQEELEEVKRIWHGWLKWIVLFLFVVAGLYLGKTAWDNYQKNKDEEATDLLVQFQNLIAQNQRAEAMSILKTLQEDYSNTIPATIATSAIGTISFYSNQFEDASRHFQWIYDHQQDKLLKSMTITDLVKIKMQQKKFDEALALLEEKTEAGLQFLFEDLKGDIYMAKGEEESAKRAYDKAISLLPEPNEVIMKEDIAQVRAQIEAKKIIQIPKI